MSIGAGEIVLLAIIALLLFGPKRLPEVGRQVGRALAELRRYSREFEREVRQVAEPFEREFRDAEQAIAPRYKLDEDHSRFDPPDESKPRE